MVQHVSTVRYASIFAKKYGTLVRYLNKRTERTNVLHHASSVRNNVCYSLTALRTVLVLVRYIVTLL